MAKITLILSTLFALVSVFFGFLNQGKVQELKGTLASTQTQLASTKSSLEESIKKGEGLQKVKEELTAKTNQQSSEITQLKSDLAVEKTKVSELNENLSTKETELALANTKSQTQAEEISQLKQRITDFEEAPKPSDVDNEKVTKLEEDNTRLLGEISALKDRVNTLQEKESEANKKAALKSLSGRVLAVNQAWNFVVLDVGDKKGAMTNAELIVKRGSTAIGRLRITSVEPASSIADIIPTSLVPGLVVQPGDQVIYANENM